MRVASAFPPVARQWHLGRRSPLTVAGAAAALRSKPSHRVPFSPAAARKAPDGTVTRADRSKRSRSCQQDARSRRRFALAYGATATALQVSDPAVCTVARHAACVIIAVELARRTLRSCELPRAWAAGAHDSPVCAWPRRSRPTSGDSRLRRSASIMAPDEIAERASRLGACSRRALLGRTSAPVRSKRPCASARRYRPSTPASGRWHR